MTIPSKVALAICVAIGAVSLGALLGCGGSSSSLAFHDRLFTVNRDGSGLRQISREERGAVFSPPAHPTRFERSRHGMALVWSPPGDPSRRLRVGGFLNAPAYVSWSPDSRTLLIGATRVAGDRRFHLFTVPASGGRLREITGEVLTDRAAWSPDGKWIAVATYDGDIELVRPDGSREHTILHLSGGVASNPLLGSNSVEIRRLAWSPDGRRLTFVAAKVPPET